MYKQCTKCKRELPLNKFEKVYKKNGYGTLRNVCRLCKNKSDAKIKKDIAKKYYAKNSDKLRKRQQEIRASGKVKIKQAAQRMVNSALELGLLFKPIVCQWCGKLKDSKNMIAHHKNYLAPLDVYWVCPSCHASVHRMIKESRQLRFANGVEQCS